MRRGSKRGYSLLIGTIVFVGCGTSSSADPTPLAADVEMSTSASPELDVDQVSLELRSELDDRLTSMRAVAETLAAGDGRAVDLVAFTIPRCRERHRSDIESSIELGAPMDRVISDSYLAQIEEGGGIGAVWTADPRYFSLADTDGVPRAAVQNTTWVYEAGEWGIEYSGCY